MAGFEFWFDHVLFSMKNFSIAIITENPDTPAETYVRQHIKKICPRNTVVVYFEGEGKSLKGIPSLKINRQAIGRPFSSRLKSLRNFIFYRYPGALCGVDAKAVADFFIEHNVTSVLAEFGTTGCAISPITQKLGLKLVVNFHGYDATVLPKRLVIRHAYRRLNRCVDTFLCGSRHFSGVLQSIGFSPDRIEVVPCGIEIEYFEEASAKDPNLVVAVGRLTEKKSPLSTIRAFFLARKMCPLARLEIVGDGPLMEDCLRLVKELKLSDSVILHGARSHNFVRKLLCKGAVFCQHSVTASNGDTESQGISLLEAMASSTPVVVTDHNGFSEIVFNNVSGFIVPEHDVEGMAVSIIRLLKDDSLRKKMGENGRTFVMKNFDSSKLSRRLESILVGSPYC